MALGSQDKYSHTVHISTALYGSIHTYRDFVAVVVPLIIYEIKRLFAAPVCKGTLLGVASKGVEVTGELILQNPQP